MYNTREEIDCLAQALVKSAGVLYVKDIFT